MGTQKIAIYSGEIPSTTFIERLVEGLADSGKKVFLFGTLKKRKKYSKNVIVVAYENRLQKAFQLLYYGLLLMLFKNNDKKKLDNLLLQQGRFSYQSKAKYYPVLYHQPDIFHLQWAKGVEDWMWVQEFGIKFVLSLRGTHITISPVADKQLSAEYLSYFPKLDGFHAVSQSIAQEAVSYGADASKIKVVYSGLDLTKFPFSGEKKTGNKLKIISVGRDHWVKGYSYALDAMALLQQENFDFHYTIIGVQNDEELLFQRAQLELQGKVFFRDNLPFETVVSEIKSADILLLPSVEEGIANVVLEAMALGTLVVSTDCGGMSEVISDGENGFLVPIRNPEAMAATIKRAALLSDESRLAITQRARQTIEKQHNESLMVADMMTLYESVLNGKR
ncbi:glycosyltransferase family 4 protein [Flavobacterium adhaerens]|uniref:glycosyltransferase family 4 protein n=1 Tax=Flavobacterium adhaerens TaxID=3149043 RepID=UPI0032B6172C